MEQIAKEVAYDEGTLFLVTILLNILNIISNRTERNLGILPVRRHAPKYEKIIFIKFGDPTSYS